MSQRNNILKFAGLSVVYFCLLTIPWPGPWAGPAPYLMNAYRWAFRTVGNVLFVRMGDGGAVKFSSQGQALHAPDTELRIENRRTGGGGTGEIKSIYTGYRPTAFIIALILATPAPWRRRAFALLWGVLLVSGFVAVRVWIRLIVMMSNPDPIRAYELSDAWKDFVGALNGVLVRSPAVGYIVPALIWMIVALRRDVGAKFGIRLGQPQESTDAGSGRPRGDRRGQTD